MADEMSADDQQAIRTVLARYCQHCDNGEFGEFADLFALDAVFEVMGMVHEGREAIGTFMRTAQPPEKRGKHLISEPWIRPDPAGDPDTARAATDYSFAAHQNGAYAITSVGRYVDVFRRVEGRWLIARREIVFLS